MESQLTHPRQALRHPCPSICAPTRGATRSLPAGDSASVPATHVCSMTLEFPLLVRARATRAQDSLVAGDGVPLRHEEQGAGACPGRLQHDAIQGDASPLDAAVPPPACMAHRRCLEDLPVPPLCRRSWKPVQAATAMAEWVTGTEEGSIGESGKTYTVREPLVSRATWAWLGVSHVRMWAGRLDAGTPRSPDYGAGPMDGGESPRPRVSPVRGPGNWAGDDSELETRY